MTSQRGLMTSRDVAEACACDDNCVWNATRHLWRHECLCGRGLQCQGRDLASTHCITNMERSFCKDNTVQCLIFTHIKAFYTAKLCRPDITAIF